MPEEDGRAAAWEGATVAAMAEEGTRTYNEAGVWFD